MPPRADDHLWHVALRGAKAGDAHVRGARRAERVATDRIGEADRVAAVGQRLVAGREKLQVGCYRLASGGSRCQQFESGCVGRLPGLCAAVV